jgi:hypothetical protein
VTLVGQVVEDLLSGPLEHEVDLNADESGGDI